VYWYGNWTCSTKLSGTGGEVEAPWSFNRFIDLLGRDWHVHARPSALHTAITYVSGGAAWGQLPWEEADRAALRSRALGHRSAFDGVDGLTKAQRRRLLERFHSVSGVAAAGADALAAAGLAPDLAAAVDRHLRSRGADANSSNCPTADVVDELDSDGVGGPGRLSEHFGPAFQTSELLLNGRPNMTATPSRFGVRRSRNR
jgi:hypothetical protein